MCQSVALDFREPRFAYNMTGYMSRRQRITQVGHGRDHRIEPSLMVASSTRSLQTGLGRWRCGLFRAPRRQQCTKPRMPTTPKEPTQHILMCAQHCNRSKHASLHTLPIGDGVWVCVCVNVGWCLWVLYMRLCQVLSPKYAMMVEKQHRTARRDARKC